MSVRPTVLGRMYAWLQDEVPATTLEAYRRASLPVFEVMDLAEARRAQCAAEGLSPWTLPPAARAELLCAWNAFVLQTLGNDILDADYEASPATVGYVPPATARQVLAFYDQVEEWLDRARQAHASPDYRLDVEVPAELPRWTAKPLPRVHLRGLLRTVHTVSGHAAVAMTFLPEAPPDTPEQQAQLNRIRQVHASAESKVRYALDLHGAAPTRDVHQRLEPYARAAIELLYELGQLLADPWRAGPAPPRPAPPKAAPLDDHALSPPPRKAVHLPGEPGFDTWCLTDPRAAELMQRDERAQRALRKLWKQDPDPARTLAMYAEIRSAFERGHVTYAANGTARVGYFQCCPWSPIYAATRVVTIAGTTIKPMQRFVLDVGGQNEAFHRRLLVGTFQETGEVQYGPHRDRQ
jgi:hypothetical protein